MSVVALAVCVPVATAQFRFPTPDERFDQMDSNHDGTIDSREASSVQGPARFMIDGMGLDFSRGVSRDDFRRSSEAAMERFRSRSSGGGGDWSGRGGGRGGFDWQSRGNRDDEDDDDDDDDDNGFRGFPGGGGSSGWGGGPGWGGPGGGLSPNVRKSTSGSVILKREPIVIRLPEAFASTDGDYDNQIGLYEWRKREGATIAQFLEVDRNGDGFLTPREIVFAQTLAAAASSTATAEGTTTAGLASTPTGSPALPLATPVGGMTTQPPAPATTVASSPAPLPATGAELTGRSADEARRSFKLLDKDRNERISPEEWDQSTRIRGMFEGAGIKLDSSMDSGEFVRQYVKLNGV